jgi:hypothetical protein
MNTTDGEAEHVFMIRTRREYRYVMVEILSIGTRRFKIGASGVGCTVVLQVVQRSLELMNVHPLDVLTVFHAIRSPSS